MHDAHFVVLLIKSILLFPTVLGMETNGFIEKCKSRMFLKTRTRITRTQGKNYHDFCIISFFLVFDRKHPIVFLTVLGMETNGLWKSGNQETRNQIIRIQGRNYHDFCMRGRLITRPLFEMNQTKMLSIFHKGQVETIILFSYLHFTKLCAS